MKILQILKIVNIAVCFRVFFFYALSLLFAALIALWPMPISEPYRIEKQMFSPSDNDVKTTIKIKAKTAHISQVDKLYIRYFLFITIFLMIKCDSEGIRTLDLLLSKRYFFISWTISYPYL